MTGVVLPPGWRFEPLHRRHPRRDFASGQPKVDEWLASRALQQQDKHLSSTRVLIEPHGGIAGFYTLATGQVDFSDLPPELLRRLPRRQLPVAVLAWLGVARSAQRQGHGRRLLAQALRDCCAAGEIFPFVAVLLDCIDDQALAFYRQWDFRPLPGHTHRLFLSWTTLEAMIAGR